MRKSFIIALLTLLTVFSVFSLDPKDKVTLKGTVTVQNRMMAEFKAGGKDYLLMLPRYYLADMKDNDNIEIEGYKYTYNGFPCGPAFEKNLKQGTEVIYVSKLTLNGKTIDIEKERDSFRKGDGRGFDNRGGGPSMMRDRGRGCQMW
jgi:hypothetical protein